MKNVFRRKRFLSILLICSLCAAVYLNACPNTFHYDDRPYVVENRLVAGSGRVDELFLSSYPPGKPQVGLYRPLVVLTYAMDGLVWGLNPVGFHLTNLLLHILASLLVYLLGLRLLRNGAAAALGALLFAAHPVHTESVSWVVGRAEILCSLFFLGSLLARPGGGPRPSGGPRSSGGARAKGLLPCLLLYLMALLCKENALTLPLLFFLLDLSVPRERGRGRASLYAGIIATTLLFLLIRFAVLGRFGPDPAQRVLRNLAAPARVATVFRVLLAYIRLLTLPVNLNIEYADSFSRSLLEPLPLLGLIFMVSYTLFLSLLWRKKKGEEAFLLLWPLATLLTVLNIFPIGEFLAERFLYLPSVGFCLLFAALLPLRGRRPKRGSAPLLFLCVILLYSLGAIRRNGDYRSPRRLWERSVRRSPRSRKAFTNLGWSLLGEKGYAGALRAYERARDIDPGLPESHFAVALCLEHLPGERYGEGFPIERCKALYRQALGIRPGFHYARYNLAVLLKIEGNREAAESELREVLAERPRFGLAHHTLGGLLAEEGKMEEAEAAFLASIRCGRAPADAHYGLGYVRMEKGEVEGAIAAFRAAIGIDPGHAEAHYRLGVVFNWLGRNGDALRHLGRALRLKPDHAEAHLNLGLLLKTLGETGQAKGHLERYLEVKPEGEFARRAREAINNAKLSISN